MSRLEWYEIDGWFTKAGAEVLGKLCDRVVNGGRIVELGSFLGRTTVFMAHRVAGRNIRILTVDNFKGGEPDDPATKFQQEKSILPFLVANLKKAGVASEVGILVCDSVEASFWVTADEYGYQECCMEAGKQYGLVFIDGNHHADAVKKDIWAWEGWAKCEQGILCGHNANEGPGQVARERFGDRVKQEANVWWVE